MTPTIEEIAALPVTVLRAALPAWVASHVRGSPEASATLEARLRGLVDAADDRSLRSLLDAFAVAGSDFRLFPADPFARVLTRAFMTSLTEEGVIVGEAHLDAFLSEPASSDPIRRMILCNHLSYTDTQLTDTLLVHGGRAAVADRLVAIAGPKVYTDAWRRLAAIGLNTRKTAQSTLVATEQGALSPREFAAVAAETLRDCERLLDAGYLVLLYPEGTRSRTGRMQSFLRAAGRYAAIEGLRILPAVQTGSERVYPIDDAWMHPSPVRLAFGPAFLAADYPGRHGHGALSEASRRMTALLPDAYRPPDGQSPIA